MKKGFTRWICYPHCHRLTLSSWLELLPPLIVGIFDWGIPLQKFYPLFCIIFNYPCLHPSRFCLAIPVSVISHINCNLVSPPLRVMLPLNIYMLMFGDHPQSPLLMATDITFLLLIISPSTTGFIP